MSNEYSTRQRHSAWRRFLILKTGLVAVSIVGLMASNVASLVSSSAHDWMHTALWQVLSIGGQSVADRALANSPRAKIDQRIKAETTDLEIRHQKLKIDNEIQAKKLDEYNIQNKKLAQQLEANGKFAKETVAKVHKRLAKGVTRNLIAVPSEIVPVLGVAATIAVTSLDVYDACQTMKDFNVLLQLMGQGVENPELCGQKVPTADQALASVGSTWRESYAFVQQESKSILNISIPEIRAPKLSEISKATCPVVKVPGLCGKEQ